MSDFLGTVAGKPMPGGKAENYLLEVGAGSALPEFETALVGLTGDARAGNKVASVGSATTPPTAGEVIEAAMRVMGRAA